MKKFIRFAYHFSRDVFEYFQTAWKAKLSAKYAKLFATNFIEHVNRFRRTLYTKQGLIKHLNEEKVLKLKHTTQGLYSLLPPHPCFTYSILLSISRPQLRFFKKTLESLIDQSVSSAEILIGLENPSPSIYQILEQFKQKYPNKLKEIPSCSFNEIAKLATGHYLFLMEENDWIRPDLLFRYEQTLRLLPHPESTILYCNEDLINEHDYVIPKKTKEQYRLHFPFIFDHLPNTGLLIPKHLWDQAEGLKGSDLDYDDLLLRLETCGAEFQHIPFRLYARRLKGKQTKKSRQHLLNSLYRYTQTKGLDWTWTLGYDSHYIRAIPNLQKEHKVQVIIPFKDQKSLTLSCVKHVLKQKHVNLVITAIDNASHDPSIAKELIELGVEVLTNNEPFNYSRLNNFAVQQTTIGQECDVIVFLNNDVDLEEEAIFEMLRWIDQPEMGMVGCRLHYPDGRLQHGGVHLNKEHPLDISLMYWEHIEKWKPFEQLNQAKQLGVCHAVTAACAMVKRENFLKVNGFDEIWYPIGYSDTNLAVKLKLTGLKSFYTPYAVGIHHESVSRKESIEDYECSYWLHQLILEKRHQHPVTFISS